MSQANVEAGIKDEPTPILFSTFLEGAPPSQLVPISDLVEEKYTHTGQAYYELRTPEAQLHCENETCNGLRFYRCTDDNVTRLEKKGFKYAYLRYRCSNCQQTTKIFSIAAQMGDKPSGHCYKFGEFPAYGPPTPARLVTLIGPDRDLFLKGRRCENQGLGIGAFVYYRRVVENQKGRILGEIIRLSQKLNAAPTAIAILEAAQKETQFSKAMDSIRDAIPQVLLIDGHNPMTLLYSALSEGLHDKTDEHCLELAGSIRVVLAELSDRLATALKNEAELNTALAKLMHKKKTDK